VKLQLTQGLSAGKSKVQVKLKGSQTVPPLPLAVHPGLVAQVRSSDGQCYGAVFSTSVQNDGHAFKARSD